MRSVTFFNNKGGVGKTTLCCNVASHLAHHHRKKVLLVDCDPQCNSTRLVLGDERCEDLYYDGTGGFSADTLLTVLNPIIDGDSSAKTDIQPVSSKDNRFDMDILPGHPQLAMLEDALSAAWSQVPAGTVEGLRRTHWATYLLRGLDRYDIVLFDVGPSLGAINRSVLIGTESFVTPMGCDIFSIVGVRNIANWLHQWLRFYRTGIENAREQRASALEKYAIPDKLDVENGFVGFTVQQYIAKAKKGVRRPTRAYEDILDLIPDEVERNLMPFARPGLTIKGAELGDVPHLYSLVPLAQTSNAPIHDLKANDGLVGAQYSQAEKYTSIIGAVAERLLGNLDTEGADV